MSRISYISFSKLIQLRSAYKNGTLNKIANNLDVPKTKVLASVDLKYHINYIIPNRPESINQILEKNNSNCYAINSLTGF